MNIVENDNVINIENNIETNNNNVFKELVVENKENLIQKKKKLIELVKNLSKIEYTEIFNIFQEDNCSYTGNSNGVFINLTNVSEFTINKIFDFIDFIKKKKKELLDKESVLENIKKDISEMETKSEKTENKDNSNCNNISYEDLSDNEESINVDNYLCFSSDEDDDLDNKLCLKKKKIKYSGKKAKLIKSIKDNNEKNRI